MTEQPTPPTLRDLLDLAMDKRGTTSGRRLAELARGHGFEVTHTTINQIRSGSYKFRPSEDTIEAFAWLAGVPAETAYAAAGRRAPGRPFAEDLPPGVDNLGPRERKAAVELLRAFVAQQERIDQLEDKAGGKGPGLNPGNPGLRLVDPADTLAAHKGRSQADIENEEADRWDGVDPPGPDDGV